MPLHLLISENNNSCLKYFVNCCVCGVTSRCVYMHVVDRGDKMSCCFSGSFLCNNMMERTKHNLATKTVSLWYLETGQLLPPGVDCFMDIFIGFKHS